MANAAFVMLPDRGVLAVSGLDRRPFLQGLVSNDVEKVGPTAARYAAFLTPQGKYLHDFMMIEVGESLWLDAEAARLGDLKKRLSIYRLRAKAALDEKSDIAVAAVFGAGAAVTFGLPSAPGAARPFGDGIPDGSRDLVLEKSILLESGFDELNGVDWEKGCYIGQELTARTKYRGLIKKRLMPVQIEGPAPSSGTIITADGREVGEMRSSRDGMGLALLRIEPIIADKGLTAGEAAITPMRPDWMHFESEDAATD